MNPETLRQQVRKQPFEAFRVYLSDGSHYDIRHPEMIAITQAASTLGSKWLNEASIYVTIEPCSMCAGALVLARIKNIVYGAKDPKTGACGSVINIVNHKKLNHRIKVEKGILEKECGYLLKEFFRKKRAKQQ